MRGRGKLQAGQGGEARDVTAERRANQYAYSGPASAPRSVHVVPLPEQVHAHQPRVPPRSAPPSPRASASRQHRPAWPGQPVNTADTAWRLRHPTVTSDSSVSDEQVSASGRSARIRQQQQPYPAARTRSTSRAVGLVTRSESLCAAPVRPPRRQDGLYDAGSEERLEHLQERPVPAQLRVLQPADLPQQEGV